MTDDVVEHRRLIIAGTGIAGLTAAIYAARSNNDPLLVEGDEPGGQLTLTTDVENYPGFPEGISGPELINNMKAQATKFGAEARNGIIVDVSKEPAGHFRVELSDGDVYTADAFIAASGASARTLGVPGEDELMGYGLSTCATCDGAFFRDEDMLVVGGGDAAMEEANFLTKFADTVYIAHRREEFRAEDVWIERTMEKVEDGEIELLLNTELTEIHGTPEDGIDHVTLVEHPDGHPTEKLDDPATADEVDEYDFDVGAVFFAIGHTPNTDFLEGPRSRPTTRGTCSPRAAAAGTRPRPASRGCSARATWSISTTSRPSPRPGWGVRPRSTPTSTSPSASAPVSCTSRPPTPRPRTTDRRLTDEHLLRSRRWGGTTERQCQRLFIN